MRNNVRNNIVLLLMFCFFLYFIGCTQEAYVDCDKLCNEIRATVARKLKEQKNLRPSGFGGSAPYDIRELCLSFDYFQEIDLNAARELLLYAIEVFVDEMNKNTAIRPYLHDYPITIENVDLLIFIRTPDGKFVEGSDNISTLSTINGKLVYRIWQDDHTNYAIEETYEEALKMATLNIVAP